MSVGRYAMRGRVFQGRVFAPRALANSGEEVSISDPSVGWVANKTNRVSVAGGISRVSVAGKTQRVIVARSQGK